MCLTNMPHHVPENLKIDANTNATPPILETADSLSEVALLILSPFFCPHSDFLATVFAVGPAGSAWDPCTDSRTRSGAAGYRSDPRFFKWFNR